MTRTINNDLVLDKQLDNPSDGTERPIAAPEFGMGANGAPPGQNPGRLKRRTG